MFLITGSLNNPYDRLRHSGQEKTWLRDISKCSNFDYRYLVSNGKEELINRDREDLHTVNKQKTKFVKSKLSIEKADELLFQASFGWESILCNFIAGIDWAFESNIEFDFIIRTNVSSYWNLKSTLQLIETLPKCGVYAGNVVKALDCEFVAGDGIILSRDVALKLSTYSELLDASVIDDVALGRFMREIQMPFTHIPRRWVRTRFDINHPDLKVGNTHHFRCKFERTILGNVFRRDIEMMKLLHKKFSGR